MGKGLWVGLILSFLAAAISAAELSDSGSTFSQRHQVGARIGVWGNLGTAGPKADTIGSSYYETDIKDACFYFEGYFGYRLARPLMLELVGGIVNRGDISINDNGESFIGNLVLYPIQLRLKVYPLALTKAKFQPFVMAGGGLYHGRNNIQFANTGNPFVTYVGESQTDFNFVAGGGLDWPVADKLALDLNVAYMPIHFSKDLIFTRDYQAVTVTVGAKYVLPLTRKK